jgi:glycosyltransferase involved in cell wall biosynthesis
MRIAYLAAGAAGMYCGSCLHDNALAAALLRAGHDVALVPLYTPLRTDGEGVAIDRVFYGAINVYLEQRSALFRHTPWLVDRLLASPGLIGWATRHSGSVDARELGELTVSVLQGRKGQQKKELDGLVRWLERDMRPDVVHLPNALLASLAGPIREALGVPVFCTLQGEDLFIEDLEEPSYGVVRRLLVEVCRDVDAFVVHSEYYARAMAEYLGVPREKIHVVHLGLEHDAIDGERRALSERPFVVGYLARLAPEKGLHLLAGAFHELARDNAPGEVRLRIAGYLSERDRAYKDGILAQLDEWGLGDAVDDVGELDRAGKAEFLRSLHVLCVPTTYHEPKGLFALEALGRGVPVVLPRHGAFPELIEATGGGVLVEPEDTGAIASALRGLMDDPPRREALGRRGRDVVRRDYTDDRTAAALLNLYQACRQNAQRS